MQIETARAALLTEMFRRVGGAEYSPEITRTPDWYLTHAWTLDDETAFREWGVAFLRKNMRWSKRLAEKEMQYFCFQWGWTYPQENG